MPKISELKGEIGQLYSTSRPFKYLAWIFVVALIGIPSFLYTRSATFNTPSESSEVLGSNNISLDEVNELVKKVSKLADVPNEVPNVATVTDAASVRNQAFFSKAENGDKVLIFQNAKRAILYRPSADKIIEYTTIVVEAEASPTPAAINIPATPSGEEVSPVPTIIFNRVTAAPTPTTTSVQSPTVTPAQ